MRNTNYKLYENKNSALKKNTRMTQGGDVELKEKRLGWWERYDFSKKHTDDITFVVEAKHQQRADKISAEVYGRDDLEWIILQYNNIVDINEEIIAGAVLRLPSVNRVKFEILVNQVRRLK